MSFQKIKGNSLALDILKEDFKKKRISHSYLFVGPEGIGKKMAAFAYAQLLHCKHPTLDFEPCGKCTNCKRIEENNHPDLHFIETRESLDYPLDLGQESQEKKEKSESIKIETIKEIQHKSSLLPYESGYKVFIIDNAHNLTEEASNAFLKTLEESSADTVIILVSAQIQDLPPTIISRCKIVKFKPLAKDLLKEILINEYKVDPDEAHFLACFSEGRLGFALRIRKHPLIIHRYQVLEGFLNRSKMLVSTGLEEKQSLRLVLWLLLYWFRDLYIIKLQPQTEELVYRERRNQLLKIRGYFSSPDNIESILRKLISAIEYLEKNVNHKLLLANIKSWIWQDSYY
ncbi:MAG: DNA polymerase III subunit delta' [Candidatus Omnitrophica bacterium]|nr:DNA polymerase III subunit delta' [Candidatus Omnitrophota bacterium]